MNLLFVCLGNICRSPMAEFIAKDLVKKTNCHMDHTTIKSAGTANYHEGEGMHSGTFDILSSHGIECNNFTSHQLTQELYNWADAILVMDDSNLNNVSRTFGTNPKVRKITDFSSKKIDEVPDPWYTGNFQEVFDILQDAISNYLVNKINKK